MMLRYTSYPRYLVALIIMSVFVLPIHITHAQGILDILMGNDDQVQSTSTDKENKNTQKELKEQERDERKNPASSTSETTEQQKPVATTTKEQSTATTTNPNPTNTTPRNNELEKLLNKIIPPAEVYTPPTTTKPRTAAPTTTPKTTQKATSTKATTTPAALTSIPDHTSPSATNYYKPLDALDPAATYSLSAVALAVGSIGALLILRDPILATRRRNMLVRNTFAHAPAFKNPLLDQ